MLLEECLAREVEVSSLLHTALQIAVSITPCLSTYSPVRHALAAYDRLVGEDTDTPWTTQVKS